MNEGVPAPAPERSGGLRRQIIAFALIALACVAGAVGYGLRVASRQQAAAAAAPKIEAVPIAALPADGRPYVVYRSTALGDTYGRVGVAYLDDLKGKRLVAPLQCERVHVAAGLGICLQAKRGAITTFSAHVFDGSFKVLHTHALAGPPSRARMSPDGRFAAVTVFVTGHSYASTGFVTRTSVIDTRSGRMVVDDMESFEVERDGLVIKAVDFNFWGITFTRDATRFYATLGTAGETLLIEGDLEKRRARVLRGDVECPSLSPDNTRIAFKRRQADGPGRFKWGIRVLDLRDGKETALAAETRNVDDQMEWLDDTRLLYGMPDDDKAATAATGIWAIPADGAGAPRIFVPLGYSPAAAQR